MRVIMAVSAVFEFLHHWSGMRHSVTILAGWFHTVLGFMTVNTFQFGMLGIAGFEFIYQVSMAGSAILVRNIIAVSNIQRLVYLVAGDAILELLPLTVGFMAFHAVWNVAMLGMAVSTVNLAVGAGIILDLFHLLGVAGIAGCDIAFFTENDI